MLLNSYRNSSKQGKTSGWTKENMFHPADIVSALTKVILAPNRAIGLTELVTYILGEGRNSHANEKGEIYGFYFNVIFDRLPRALLEIKKQFPQINSFVESLDEKEFEARIKDDKYEQQFVKSLEERFGKEVAVTPIVNKLEVKPKQPDDNNVQILVFRKSKL